MAKTTCVTVVAFTLALAPPAVADTVRSTAGSLTFDLRAARTEEDFTAAEATLVHELWQAALVAGGVEPGGVDASAIERPRVYATAITERTRRTTGYVAGVYLPERHVVVVESLDFESLVHEFVHAVVAKTQGLRKTADEAYIHGLVDGYVEKLRTTVTTSSCATNDPTQNDPTQSDAAVLDRILAP